MKFFVITSWLMLGVALSIVADVFLKKSDVLNMKWLLLGVVLYGLAAIPVAFLFKLVKFGNLFIIWEAGYLVLGILIANIFYGEVLTISRVAAILLALGALVLSYQ